MNTAKAPTEDEFIEAIRNNNEFIMNKLYKTYYPMIEHFVVTNGGLAEEAKDIYQEAFIILYENLQEPDFQLTCKIKTYIYSVCRRLWLKRFSYKTKYQGDLTDSEEFLPLEEDENIEEHDLLFGIMEDSLNKLGEPCRTILEDYYINDFNMVQIAAKMGYTNADNAKNQKYKCLMRLKKIAENMNINKTTY
jgi:RNA polymerase sigma factor (sigma-70 family)